EIGLDLASAHLAANLGAAEPALDRLDLEVALTDVLEVLGRPEEHVDERAEERWKCPDQRREGDQQRALDPPARVLQDPRDRREPEEQDDGGADGLDGRPGARMEEIVHSRENAPAQRKNLPMSQPAANASPT